MENNTGNNDEKNLKLNSDMIDVSSKDLIEKINNTEFVELQAHEDLSDEKIIVTKVLEMFILNIKPTTLREAAGIQDDVAITEKVMVVVVIDYLVDRIPFTVLNINRIERVPVILYLKNLNNRLPPKRVSVRHKRVV